MAGRLVLVLDPDPAIRQSLIDVLSLEGHEVDGAGDADSALLILDQRRYDLVVADLRLPDLDGPRLLTALGERFGEDLPALIFVTSATFDPHYGGFLADLRAPVMLKPLKPGRVLDLVGKVLGP
jgi:DNA-binding response OmpR family regulator